MKPAVPAKALAFLYVAAVASMGCAVAALVAQSYADLPRRRVPEPVEASDAMLSRLTQAQADLGKVAPARALEVRASRPAPVGQTFALHVPKPAGPAASEADPLALDSPTLSLVILKTHKSTQIVLDGKPARIGQVLPGGARITGIGKTFIDLEDAEGTRRRIDIKNRFTTEAARQAS